MSDHVVPVRIYYAIFAALLVMTALTVAVAFVDLGRMNTVIALTIAVIKATLVILFFMHLYYGSRLTWIVLATGFFWLAVLITFTMSDVLSRGWLSLPGK
jgi:cytochrome c oxidase subunit 4